MLGWKGSSTMDLYVKGWEDLVFVLRQMSPVE